MIFSMNHARGYFGWCFIMGLSFYRIRWITVIYLLLSSKLQQWHMDNNTYVGDVTLKEMGIISWYQMATNHCQERKVPIIARPMLGGIYYWKHKIYICIFCQFKKIDMSPGSWNYLADQRKHQSPASLDFVRRIHRGQVNSPHKGPGTRKMFPFDDVIMVYAHDA